MTNGEQRDPQQDVRQFMQAFGQHIGERPSWPDRETCNVRIRLETEEFRERLRDSGYGYLLDIWEIKDDCFQYVCGGRNHPSVNTSDSRSLPKTADAIMDEIYVLLGSLAAMGVDFWPLWDAVHAANMAKAGGPVVDGKVKKPEGWQPPDIEGELRKQGWEGD